MARTPPRSRHSDVVAALSDVLIIAPIRSPSERVRGRPWSWARSRVAAITSILTTDAVLTRCPRRRWYQQPVRSSWTAAVTWWAAAP